MPPITCIVVTPETTAFEEQVDFVAVPLFDGELGVAPGHSPLIGRLGYGELRLKTDGKISRWYIDGGFVQVSNNVVSVLTGRAMAASSLDGAHASEQLSHALQMPANTPELMEIRDRTIMQARAQLRLATRK